MLTATLTADTELQGNTQRTHWHWTFVFINARALGDTSWMPCVQLAVMRSQVLVDNGQDSLMKSSLAAKKL